MELKSEQIESYARLVDSFNDNLNRELPERLQPIMATYLAAMGSAGNDGHARDEASERFSSEVHTVLSKALGDYLTIQYETFYIKVLATEALGDLLTRLERRFDESFQLSRTFLKEFIAGYSDQEMVTDYYEKIRIKGQETTVVLTELAGHIRQEFT